MPAAAPAPDPPDSGGEAWGWLAGFCLARAAFGTINMAYAGTLPLVTAEWRMTASEAGLVSSAFNLGALTSLFLAGLLMDRFGAKRIYLFSSAAAAASALAFAAFARDFHSALAWYGLAGLCSGGTYTPGLAILAERFRSGRRGLAIGAYLAASSAGYALSLVMSSAVIPWADWQGALWATGAAPTVGMLLGAWMLRSVSEVARPARGAAAALGNSSASAALLRNRAAVLIILAYVFHTWELLGIWAWLPYFLAVAHGDGRGGSTASLGAASAGAAFGAFAHLAGLAGSILGGPLSDRFGRTTIILALSLLSAGAVGAMGWLAAAPFAVVVVLALLAQLTSVGDSPVLSAGLTELVPGGQLGAAFAWRSLIGFGAGAVSPWVFGWILDRSHPGQPPSPESAWGLAFLSLAVGGLLCPVAIVVLRRLPDSLAMAGGRR